MSLIHRTEAPLELVDNEARCRRARQIRAGGYLGGIIAGGVVACVGVLTHNDVLIAMGYGGTSTIAGVGAWDIRKLGASQQTSVEDTVVMVDPLNNSEITDMIA